MLRQLRCVQLDPLDVLGTNADLVALARVEGLRRGDVYRHAYPGHAFEHFAKERCLLPAEAFPWYREQKGETLWWRLPERLKRLPEGVVEAVLQEIRERGPLSAAALDDRGKVEPIDWNGWKSTARASSMAVDILWTRCEVVVCGRERLTRIYDIPERALPKVAQQPARGDFHEWAVLDRVEAAGLLAKTGGPVWSVLARTRKADVIERLIEQGRLEEVEVEGASRKYLAPAGFRERRFPASDGRIRILGPLDPLLWDRALVKQAFGFDYVWEVYKPAHQRRWGWYVCPLLQHDRLVGRLEGVVEGPVLQVRRLWKERGVKLEEDALAEALERHALACGAEKVVRARRGGARAAVHRD